MKIKELAEKPREKAILNGVSSLSDAEVLSILIESGSRQASAFDLAMQILNLSNGMKQLGSISMADLTSLPGIKQARAIRILAAIELARRIAFHNQEEIHTIGNAKDVYTYLENMLRFETQEKFVALYLDSKHQIIHQKILFVGSLNCSVVHPREVFKGALQVSAACVLVAHNHPSGDPEPSSQDLEVTNILKQTGEIMQIPLIDHVIIGHRMYFSFREAGLL